MIEIRRRHEFAAATELALSPMSQSAN